MYEQSGEKSISSVYEEELAKAKKIMATLEDIEIDLYEELIKLNILKYNAKRAYINLKLLNRIKCFIFYNLISLFVTEKIQIWKYIKELFTRYKIFIILYNV
ncbi:hypothetical protein PFMG_00656 [Plasmodium falciparum IGH-CR14]|uniref:Uncharacterized protein n=4 Tax=Plasmodium falciparum TaxID=5833 RepID=A0A024X863_PLAFC|nr:hypothetical protein PFNF135_06325 [Plasmodium falciparum NF135/5.C10]ETW61285.1 hypothetical protein PFMC_02705 [Plasmodium falciparum CAMP/Malaysia]EUR72026.1 hypothetical protein PFBG_02805 [Plasmodium falciparum 7G8]KNG74557.1 hypothetical protein PFMG_00656 [Plasmodium falciparum IGH-CR14]